MDKGSGTYEEVADGWYDFGTVVARACYTSFASLRVLGAYSNAWIGSIEVSTDGESTWNPMICTDCNGDSGSGTRSTASIVVEYDSSTASYAPTDCVGNVWCTIVVPSSPAPPTPVCLPPSAPPPTCVRVITASSSVSYFSDGYARVKAETSSGAYADVANGFYELSS